VRAKRHRDQADVPTGVTSPWIRAFACAALAVLALTGCSGPGAASRTNGSTAHSGSAGTSSEYPKPETSTAAGPAPSSTTTSSSSPTVLGPAPAAPGKIDWANASVPGNFCAIPGLVQLDNGHAVAHSRTHGQVHVDLLNSTASSGSMAGRKVWTAEIDCNNGWGTADGQWAFAEVIAETRGPDLVLVGELTAQYDPPGDVHTSLLGNLRFDRTGVSVTEHWYRKGDPTCCPSGTAHTRWTLTGDGLHPGPPRVTNP
jgi:hypothetical protein